MKKNKKQTITLFILISLLFIGCGKKNYIPIAEVTVPSYLIGEETDSFSIIEEGNESITYQLIEDQQTEILHTIEMQIEESIQQVLTDKQYYPNIIEITANKDYSKFDVTFQSAEINIYETTLRMSLYIAGNKYQLYQGIAEDSIITVVNYINTATGEVFSTGNSDSLPK